MKLEPGTSIGPYRIVSELGRGGMATVYKAHQASLARYVAIKVLPEFFATEPGFKERFQQEAVAVANLRHPNIPAVFDYGETDGVTYIVTEFVDGGTLTDQLGKPLPVEYGIEVLTPVAAALDYAHSRGVLHRDIKPSNILLEHDGTPILSDFGLAKMLTSGQKGLTQSGMIVGTPEYMAPEQCEGVPDLTPAADLYALGVVAYEVLTGRPPFIAETPVAVIMAQINNTLPPPRQVNPDLPEAVEKVLLKALAKAPADRYRTCRIFVRELSEAASARPAAAAASTAAAAAMAPTPVAPAAAAPVASAAPAAPVAPVTPPPSSPTTPPPSTAATPPPSSPATPSPISAPPPPSYGPPTPPPQPSPIPPAFTQSAYSAPPSPWPPYQAPVSQAPTYSGAGVPAPAGMPGSGARTWLIVLLAVSLGLSAFSVLFGIAGTIGATDSGGQAVGVIWIIFSVVLCGPLVAALVGVVRRRTWGAVVSYISAGLLTLSCLGVVLAVPIAILTYRARIGN